MNIGGPTVTCENCANPIPVFAYDMHLALCRKLGISNVQYVEPELSKQQQAKYIYGNKKQVVVVKKHNRKCRICGKPCWPNYFWCQKHTPKMEVEGY